MSPLDQASVASHGPGRALRRAAGRAAREAGLWPRLLRGATGRRSRVAFLPQWHMNGSGRLRATEIARALEEGRGWATLVVPGQLGAGQRRRVLGAFRPDLVVVQQCRHPLNRAAPLARYRTVLDIDDADFLDPALAAPMEAVARGAAGVIAGSAYIARWARPLNATTTTIWTGNRVAPGARPPHAERRPIVTWAQSDPLAYPHEMAFVTDVVCRAAALGPRFTLRLHGWRAGRDHPALTPFAAAGIAVETVPPLPYDDFLASLREVALGLSPIVADNPFSRGKSFGKVLGYLDAKVPVICSDAADHSRFFTPETGIVSNAPEAWAEAIAALVADPDRRQRLADAAFAAYEARLSLEAAAERTDRFLRRLLAAAASPTETHRHAGPAPGPALAARSE